MSKHRTRGAGHVRERGKGVYQLVVSVDYRQFAKTVRAGTMTEARKALTIFSAEVATGTTAKVREARSKAKVAPTFREAAAEFLDREIGNRPATHHAYENAFRRAGGLIGADRRVSEITRHDVRDAMLAVNKDSALNTVKIVHSAIGRLFRNLADREIIPASPVQTLNGLKLPPPGKEAKQREAMTADQVRDLLAACREDHELRLWIILMAATGMRPGEAAAVTWKAIDFDRFAVRVLYSVKESDTRGRGTLGVTKTDTSRREIPLGPTVMAALEAAYLEREVQCERVGLAVAEDDCVFPADMADAKAPHSMGAWRMRFNAARDRAGLKGVTPHALRHTFATAAIAGAVGMPGVSMADAATLLGHANSAMVAKVYGHAVRENLTRGVALADALVSPRPSLPRLGRAL